MGFGLKRTNKKIFDNEKIENIKKNICKILYNKGNNGVGFFCNIPFSDESKLLPVLISNNNILNKKDIISNKKIKLLLNNDEYEIIISDSRKIYTNDKYNITIIEIKNEDNLKIDSFLEFDNQYSEDKKEPKNNIFLINNNGNKNMSMKNKNKKNNNNCDCYLLKKIKNIDEYKFNFEIEYKTEGDFIGSPLINLNNYKVIGLSIENNKDGFIGTFIKRPIENFINENKGVIKK